MGREIRRVPLDFEWPLNKVWGGFLMPSELRLPRCPDCDGGGWTAGYQWLSKSIHRIGMAAGHASAFHRGEPQRGDSRMHPYLSRDEMRPTRPIYRLPTEQEVESAKALVARHEALGEGAPGWITRIAENPTDEFPDGYADVEPSYDLALLFAALATDGEYTVDPERLDYYGGMSHEYRVIRRIIAAAGLDPDVWGRCDTCKGSGDVATDEQRDAQEAWQPADPPEGEGWQLWETVSEGSPISPVFPDDEGLIVWLSTEYSWGAQHHPMTREQAEAFVRNVGWAPSLIYTPATGLQDGATALADAELAKQEG